MLEKARHHLKNNLLLCGFVLIGLIALITPLLSTDNSNALAPTETTASVDTYIPQGYVLVPIEVANAESLSSLLGNLGGVVDLYATTLENLRGKKVGSRLKILRAPLNPQQYAVLVKDSDSDRLLMSPGPFIAVIQNPEAKGTQLTASGPSKIKIDYQN